mgnify:FL=1
MTSRVIIVSFLLVIMSSPTSAGAFNQDILDWTLYGFRQSEAPGPRIRPSIAGAGAILANDDGGSEVSSSSAVPGDFDDDQDVDQEDFGLWQACVTGPDIPQEDPACARMKLDADSDVDLDDLKIIEPCQTGPAIPAVPSATVQTSVVAGSGSILVYPQKDSYYCGEVVTVTALPEAGWVLSSWSGDLSGSEPQQTLTMTESRSIQALFEEDLRPLEITNVSVIPSFTGAVVTWQTNKPATSAVAYGLTTAYELGTVEDQAYVTEHSLSLSGLTAGTTYHLQVTSADNGGASVSSEDVSFHTPLPGGLVSDDFNACQLNTSRWQFVNPLGDAEVRVVGAGTADAVVELVVPPNVSHDLWTMGNFAPRLMQPATNTDFTIEAKFDSPVVETYQLQGLIVEETVDHYVRFDVHSREGDTRLFAAVLQDGNGMVKKNTVIPSGAPIWLRVQRAADLWTLTYSYDGTNWLPGVQFTYAMEVTAAGVYAANHPEGTAPSFVARVDYFFNSAAPVSPEDGLLAGSAGASLQTSVSGSGTIQVTPLQEAYYCGETVTVTAVPEPGWMFSGWDGDLSGSEPQQTLTMTESRSIQALFEEDLRPLEITNVSVIPSFTGAVVTWQTNKPATSAVAYGLTTAYELGTVEDQAYVTEHSLSLSGLTAGTTYHLQVTSVNEEEESASSQDLVFHTPIPGGFVSDDFNAFNFNLERWSIISPLQDAIFRLTGTNTPDAVAEIVVPAGVAHDPWTAGNFAPRLMQPTTNTDFTLEAKFDSPVVETYQLQGLIVEETVNHYLRFGMHSRDGTTHLYAAVLKDGSSTVKRDAVIPSGAPIWLRVQRAADVWTFSYSYDGTNWLEEVSFPYAMQVTAVGPFAGNAAHGSGVAPAFTARIDYVFNSAIPIDPEDGAVVEDTQPPALFDLQLDPAVDAIMVRWRTDEPANARVRWGLTTDYELGSFDNPSLQFEHVMVVGKLEPGTTYNLQIVSADAGGREALSDNLVVTTPTWPQFSGPAIDVWYGTEQAFGEIGLPIPYVNILGRVDVQNLASLQYSLNGKPFRPLAVGPNSCRLAAHGDFNVELDLDQLLIGLNRLELRSLDMGSNENRESVLFSFRNDRVWPLPHTVRWSDYTSVVQGAQLMDGKWVIDDDSTIRLTEFGCDRLVLIGDRTWTDYQVTVPVMVKDLAPASLKSATPEIGLICHWPGYTQINNELPRAGFIPLGGMGCYKWRTVSSRQFELVGYDNQVIQSLNAPFELNVWYMMKMQVQAVGDMVEYRFKCWPEAEPEPAEWMLQGQQSNVHDPNHGSVALVAYYVDVVYGDVVVEPVPDP